MSSDLIDELVVGYNLESSSNAVSEALLEELNNLSKKKAKGMTRYNDFM